MMEQNKPYRPKHAGPIKIKDPDAPRYEPRHAKPKGLPEPRRVIPVVAPVSGAATSSLWLALGLTALLVVSGVLLINLLGH